MSALAAPFPWFGGKRKVAPEVWSALGDPDNYVEPFDGPLALTVHFRFPMPASRKAAVRRAGYGPKSTAPDLDKLIRAVGDSLQAGGLVADDARFCEITATKTEVRGWTGVEITVTDRLDWHNHGPSPRVHGNGEQSAPVERPQPDEQR